MCTEWSELPAYNVYANNKELARLAYKYKRIVIVIGNEIGEAGYNKWNKWYYKTTDKYEGDRLKRKEFIAQMDALKTVFIVPDLVRQKEPGYKNICGNER